MLNYLFPFSFMCFGVFGMLHSKSDVKAAEGEHNIFEKLVHILSNIFSFMLVIISSIWMMLYFTG